MPSYNLSKTFSFPPRQPRCPRPEFSDGNGLEWPMRIFWVFLVCLSVGSVAFGSTPCLPCFGVVVDNGAEAISALEMIEPLGVDETFFVAWDVPLDGTFDADVILQVEARGAIPWLVVEFATEWPPIDHEERLAAELATLVGIARHVGPETRFQIEWPGGLGSPDRVDEFAYVLKRASVAVQGANPKAQVFLSPTIGEGEDPRAVVSADIGAYIDGIVLKPHPELAGTLEALGEILPGFPVVINAVDPSRGSDSTIVEAARNAAFGAGTTFVDHRGLPAGQEELVSLVRLAGEFSGDLAPDVTAKSGPETWAFVRADDLGLRVVVDPGEEASSLVIADKSLADPQIVGGRRIAEIPSLAQDG